MFINRSQAEFEAKLALPVKILETLESRYSRK